MHIIRKLHFALLHYAVEKTSHFGLSVSVTSFCVSITFLGAIIAFCVSITACGDSCYILRRFLLHVAFVL